MLSCGLTGLVNPEGFSKIDSTRMPPTPSASGAVSTLVYDCTVDILGHVDDSTGAITYDDGQGGYDLLSRMVVTVLDRGGEAIAVRREEITATIWRHRGRGVALPADLNHQTPISFIQPPPTIVQIRMMTTLIAKPIRKNSEDLT
jgi:hypothetical protein